MDWGEWQKEIIMWGGKREEGGKWEERLRPWRLDEEDCGGVFQQQGGVWGMKQDTGPNAGTPAWNKYQDHMYCSVGGFGMFWHMMKHLKVTSCCAEYDIMLCLNMFQVEHDQQKSLMELSLQQKSLTLQYKRRAFPPSIQLFLTDLSDKEFVLIYQLVALVVCLLVVVVSVSSSSDC